MPPLYAVIKNRILSEDYGIDKLLTDSVELVRYACLHNFVSATVFKW